MDQRVLITGGAGFVGSSLALELAARHPDWEVVAADNLSRRGSELNLPRLAAGGVRFAHADVRRAADLDALGPVDALVHGAAEPSVLGDARVLVDVNLLGARNCFALAERHGARVVLLSTSRVYPVAALEQLAWVEAPTRFELSDAQERPGASSHGIAEDFPLAGRRTMYGASKLAAELLLAEHDVSWTIDRCGVVAGPWQMGRADQGVFAHWVLAHLEDRPLRYLGYGGTGKQVRDVLHVADLVDLLERQLVEPGWDGETFNVGGGRAGSLSLAEATALCRELTGHAPPVEADPRPRPGDVRIYLSDPRRLHAHSDWRPRRDPRSVLGDISTWGREHSEQLRGALGGR